MDTLTTNKIKIPVGSKEQAAALVNKRTVLASLFGAGGALGIVSAASLVDNPQEVPVDAVVDAPSEAEVDCVEVTVAEEISEFASTESFGASFASARAAMGPGGVFKYGDDYYHTYTKEEWEVLTDADKDDFYASMDQGVDYDNVNYISHTNEVTRISIDHDPESEITLVDENSDGYIDEIIVETSSGQVTISADDLANDGEIDLDLDQPTDVLDDINMDDGGFGNLEDIPEPESEEYEEVFDTSDALAIEDGDLVDPSDIDSIITDESATEVVTVDDADLVDSSDGQSTNEFLDDYFEDDLPEPEVDAESIAGEDLPDPMSDVDLNEWDF